MSFTLTHHRFAILVAKFAKILQIRHANHKRDKFCLHYRFIVFRTYESLPSV